MDLLVCGRRRRSHSGLCGGAGFLAGPTAFSRRQAIAMVNLRFGHGMFHIVCTAGRSGAQGFERSDRGCSGDVYPLFAPVFGHAHRLWYGPDRIVRYDCGLQSRAAFSRHARHRPICYRIQLHVDRSAPLHPHGRICLSLRDQRRSF